MKGKYIIAKIFIALLFIAIVIFEAQASDAVAVKVFPKGNNKMLVSLNNETESRLNFSIENISGTIAYFEGRTSTEKSYSKIFDISLLADGQYVLVVGQKGVDERYIISKSNGIVVLETETVASLQTSGSISHELAYGNTQEAMYFIDESQQAVSNGVADHYFALSNEKK